MDPQTKHVAETARRRRSLDFGKRTDDWLQRLLDSCSRARTLRGGKCKYVAGEGILQDTLQDYLHHSFPHTVPYLHFGSTVSGRPHLTPTFACLQCRNCTPRGPAPSTRTQQDIT
eukprot:m.133908 g.133908  ORF g.133908 m.133908 type:complete len:115 (-) comp22506_c0_seq1:28-372(-)